MTRLNTKNVCLWESIQHFDNLTVSDYRVFCPALWARSSVGRSRGSTSPPAAGAAATGSTWSGSRSWSIPHHLTAERCDFDDLYLDRVPLSGMGGGWNQSSFMKLSLTLKCYKIQKKTLITDCLIIFVRFSVFRTNKPITSYYFIITSFIFCSNSFETIQPIDLCFSPCVEEG